MIESTELELALPREQDDASLTETASEGTHDERRGPLDIALVGLGFLFIVTYSPRLLDGYRSPRWALSPHLCVPQHSAAAGRVAV